MTTTAALLASLDAITFETRSMLTALDAALDARPENVREARRRVHEIQTNAQELLDLLSDVRLEETTH